MSTTQKQWLCTVCGYIHTGPEPPEVCPVCGATADLFEEYHEKQESSQTAAPSQWRCLNCEYIHTGAEPPETCPVCAAPPERFEPFEDSGPVQTAGEKVRVVIAGAGIAGVSAAESVRKSAPSAEILLISKEEELPYYRLNLTRYLAGEIDREQLSLHPEKWYEKQNIQLRIGTELRSIDWKKREITLTDGGTVEYDRLIVAVGSHPFVPPVPGANKENVTPLRTKGDADFILDVCSKPVRCVVVGGGVLGLETAGALAQRGTDVTLLEGHGWLMPRQLNETAGRKLEDHAKSLGITIRKNARTKKIQGDTGVRSVLLEDGSVIPADLVVFATGVRSNSYVARLSNLEVNKGIIVNNKLSSSVPGVFAAGDVAEHQGTTYGTWGPSQFQGSIAGMNAAGVEADFAGIPRSNMLKVLGYDMFSIGRITPEDGSYTVQEFSEGKNYAYFLLRDSHLIGAILLGDTSLSAKVKKIIEQKLDCSGADDIRKRAAEL